MAQEKIDRYVYMDITTLENIYHFGIALRVFFQRAYLELISPLGLRVNLLSKAFYRKPSCCLMNRMNWLDVGRHLASGEIEELFLSNNKLVCQQCSGDPAVMVALRGPAGFPYCANGVELSIRRDLISGNMDVFQERLLEITLDTFKSLKAVSGYITIDNIQAGMRSASPFEQKLNLDYQKASWNFRNKFRGAYWGNILSTEHIKKLGGLGKVKSKAPAYRIAEMGQGDSNAVFIQLSPSLDIVSPWQMEELQQYLQPILPGTGREVKFKPFGWRVINR